MVLAKKAANKAAEDGVKNPVFDIILPYRGCAMAMTMNKPDMMVEYAQMASSPNDMTFRRGSGALSWASCSVLLP